MEPEDLLPLSQVPATCPSPEPVRSSPYPQIPLPEDPSKYYPPVYAWVSQVVSFHHFSPPKSCIHLSFIRVTCSAHLFLLDLITRTILGEQYRSLSSSLGSFLHSPVILSLLGLNILFNTLFSNTFLLQCERPRFTPIKTKRQNYISVYL